MKRRSQMKILFPVICFLTTLLSADVITVSTSAPENRCLEVYYRLPAGWNRESGIMILFGGRNWSGRETLSKYRFEAFADKYNLILLSPSFVNDDYWEPEKWSGRALFTAVRILEKKLNLKRKKMLYYGYSAGGQCAVLFYAYAPERVLAFGAHACGVYFDARKWKAHVPALITCGTEDSERLAVSRNFIYGYRESGGSLIWKSYPMGHALQSGPLEIAQAFFGSILENAPVRFVGEDDSGLCYPAGEKENVDVEFRNPLPEGRLLQLWRLGG